MMEFECERRIEMPLLRRRVCSESSESFEIQFVMTAGEEEAEIESPLLPNHLARRLQAVERERLPLMQRLVEAEQRRHELLAKRAAAASVYRPSLPSHCCATNGGGKAFEICFTEETARVTPRYLPARLQQRLQSVRNKWPRAEFHERLAAVERRRQRLFEKRAFAVRSCERRCLRLAQAVEAVCATQDEDEEISPRCSNDLTAFYRDLSSDIGFILERFENRAARLNNYTAAPIAPRQKGATSFNITFGEDSGKELPQRLRHRLEQLKSRKQRSVNFEERLEAARLRRQCYVETRVLAARESEDRCIRLTEAMNVIYDCQDHLREHQHGLLLTDKPRVKALYAAIQADLAFVLGRMEEESSRLTTREFRHMPKEYILAPPSEPHVKTCLCERCAFFRDPSLHKENYKKVED